MADEHTESHASAPKFRVTIDDLRRGATAAADLDDKEIIGSAWR